jgi:hypothetical protein
MVLYRHVNKKNLNESKAILRFVNQTDTILEEGNGGFVKILTFAP